MQSDILTTDDIDDIASVIQLSPHVNTTFLTPITPSEEGDLISLDELYEKTGQEAISTIVRGFRDLVDNRRLKKEHGLILKVEGAESWMELPDRTNAIKGSEGFINNITQGFVKIIRAIIKYVKSVCNWIFVRVKSLLGFSKTKEEVKFLHQKTESLKEYTAQLFSILGIYGFDPKDLVKELPTGETTWGMLNITKSRLDTAKAMFERLPEIIKQTEELRTQLAKCGADIEQGKKQYDLLMQKVRDDVKKGDVRAGFATSIKQELSAIAKTNLDPTAVIEKFRDLTQEAYCVDFKGIGLETGLVKMRDKIQDVTDSIKIPFNAELYDAAIQGVEAFNAIKNDPEKNRILGEKGIGYLKNFVEDSDSEVIDSISRLMQDNELKLYFVEFCETVKSYSGFIDIALKLIQDVEVIVTSVSKASDKMTALVVGYATENIALIRKAHETLTDEERAKLENKEGKLLYFQSLNDQFYKLHPDGHVSKKVSDAMAAFFSTSPGKKVLSVSNNFLNQYSRKR